MRIPITPVPQGGVNSNDTLITKTTRNQVLVGGGVSLGEGGGLQNPESACTLSLLALR